MAPRCRSTWETTPLIVFILTASFLSITFAKPFQSEEFTLPQSDVHYYTTSSDYEYVKPVRLGTRHQRSVDDTSVTSTIELSVEGFDQVFNVQLHASMDLFNAGLLIRRVGVNGQVRTEQPSSACYHQGHLKDMKDTTSVSLSTCNGLVGLIRTPEADFALKPLKENHILKMGPSEAEAPTHIMYKVSPADMATLQVDSENERRRASDAETRETSGTKFVETSVVADSTMFDNHGDDTEFYLFTILNQVAGLFRDRSLSTDLRLLITSITILEAPQSNLDLTDELSHSLKNFCIWQKDETSDISVLLTRRDLEIGGNHAVTGKAKDVGGACDPHRRCIIAEDHGPSGTIFTLAHEIGHSLGMYHDDAESGCENHKNVMATDNSGGSEAFKWSRCSNNDLQEFLSLTDSKCLEKIQDDFPAYSSDTVVMPGHFYDAVKQCQMTFGPEATVAEDYIYSPEMCLQLQCMVPGQSEPVTNHIPALDGTKCGSGRGMICVHGQCLKVVSMYDCDGGECVPEWLAGSYGVCQADCYSYRNVFCIERHDDGTTVLVQDESLCPEDKPVEREYCCNSMPVVGETSYQVLNTSCSVTCGTGVETREVACVDSEGTVVSDTLCDDTPPPLTAECAPAACPGVNYVLFYSNYGACSATCGDGVQSRTAFCSSTDSMESVEICRLVFPSVVTETTCNLGACQGTVVETYFYQTSPIGACSVTCGNGVQQLDVTCQDLSGTVVDDVNCESLQRPASTEMCVQDACTQTYRYVATSFSSCSVTCGTGVRTRTVFCLNEANQVMDDSFCVSAALDRPTEEEACVLTPCSITYSYEADPFPECTLTCGSQVFTRVVTCISSENNIVSNVNCVNAGLEAPASVFDCNLEPCGNFVYAVGEYGECSATCGIGIQQRSVMCIDLDNDNQTVSNDQCSGTAPPSAILCDQGDCPTEYSYLTSAFSECSCAGIQTRFVVCITFVNGAPVRATDQDCSNAGLEPPSDTQACEAPSSCNPVWRFGEWSDCSVTCGNGVQTRIVFCVESEDSNVIVPSTSCNATEEPSSVQICNDGDCVTYTWVSENFGECSVTCGEGVRVRNVLCYAISGGAFELVDGSLCDPALEPTSLEICDLEECGGVYDTSEWSACSVTCAVGVQTRDVFCVTTKGSDVILDESECSNMTRPSESRQCYLDACPLPYGCDQTYLTEGSITYTLQSPGYPLGYPADLDCSKILMAPEGSIISITFTDLQLEEGCAYDSIRLIDEESNSIRSLCDEVDLPYTYESTGPRLRVLFLTDATVSRRGYSATYQAVPATVLEIVPGEWGECSVTCGEGMESRDLICEEDGEPVDFVECLGLPAPPSTRPCALEECPSPGACGDNIVRRGPGFITSPEYPDMYPVNVTCVNTLLAPPGLVVQINVNFILFPNPGSVACGDGDSLVIRDTSSTAPPEYICERPMSGLEITSLTNEVSVTFSSDSVSQIVGAAYFITYEFVQPTVDLCGGEVTTSGQPIYSPDYPENYEGNVTCVTNITNDDGCINIEFLSMDISNGDRVDVICNEDYLVLSDDNNPSLTQTYCGDQAPEFRWLSASGNVQVKFFSNGANSSEGYIAIPRFVECPQAFWVPLPFGNCSASCGFGNRTRELECRNALTNAPTDPTECPEDEPPRTEICFLEECPSCDASLTEGNRVIEFPFMSDYYLYNDECTLTITNEEGCMQLFFISLDVDESTEEGSCDGDYLEIFDPNNMYANEPYCDGSINQNYQTLGSTVELTLNTIRGGRYKSFEVFPSFGSCPTYAFVPGPWSECSESCEGGVRSREVNCLNLGTQEVVDAQLCENSAQYETEEECNTEECPECSQNIMSPGVIVSPGFESEEGYDNNLDCVYNITNPDSEECVIISFDSFDLGEPSLNCSDYVQITDTEGEVRARYCGLAENDTVPVFYSRSSFVEMVFKTDEDGQNDGFEALVSFGSCPEFGFFTSNFSECSVTCGEGVETREVECRRFSNGQVVSDVICRDERPADSRPCMQPECPSCDRVLTEEGIFTSPNSPRNYENDQECEYTLISGPEECIRVSFIGTFELGETREECEEGDYLELSDENWEYLDTTLCGNERPPIWRSRTNVSSLTFHSDDEDTFRGFTAYLAFVECPQFGFTVGEYGECDTTCGMGVQTRDVECRDLNTNEIMPMVVCTDPLPPSIRECDNDPCPRCYEELTENNAPIIRDVFMENEECIYNVTSLEGQCIRVYLVNWALNPPPNEIGACEGDSLQFVDAEYPERTVTVCGQGGSAVEINTYGSTGLIYFNTDDVDNGGNFQMFTRFEDCPEYGYTGSVFGECSVTCGVGIRRRNVTCTRLATGESVGFGNCTEDEPSSTEQCYNRPCFDCNMSFNQSATIVSPGYPNDYPENLYCVYEFTNPMPDGCWSIEANDFSLEPFRNGSCRDVLLVQDTGFEGREPFYLCGDVFADRPILSFSNQGQITFFTNEMDAYSGFNISVNAVTCPQYGFISGPYGECSVTCGVGVQYRNVTCRDLTTREAVNESLCNDNKPWELFPCVEEDCPSCDELIFEDAQTITSPNFPDNYDNDMTCSTTIIAPEGMCINLFIISLELEEPKPYAGCFGSDYLTFIDAILPVEPYYTVNQLYCGSQENILWTSSQNVAVLSFGSNENQTYGGYEIYSSFVDCQRYFYGATEFGECSVTCGLGVSTREIGCVDRFNNYTLVDEELCADDTPPILSVPCYESECPEACYTYIDETQNFTSPGYPETYESNLECTYELYNPEEEGCWEITFYDFLTERGCFDIVTIRDQSYPIDDIVLCRGLEEPYISISNSIEIAFDSDGSFGERGFFARAAPIDCVLDYAFIPGPWSECSVTCGRGMETRDVECIYLRNGTAVDASFCNGTRVMDTRGCGVPCPPCFESVYDEGTITSSNYPEPYDKDQVCRTYIYPPEGLCVSLFIINLELSEPDETFGCLGRENDHILIYDAIRNGGYSIDQLYCGTEQNILWRGATSAFTYLYFDAVSDREQNPGYEISVNFSPCARYYYGVGPFEGCSTTCGLGMNRRDVFCVDSANNNTIVDDAFCSGDIRPFEVYTCFVSNCPSCDLDIREDNQTTVVETGIDEACDITFYNEEGCNKLSISLELTPPNENGDCKRDFIVYSEYAEYPREISLCGNTTLDIISRSNRTVLTLLTDSVDDTDYNGFIVVNEFVECPAYGFVADEDFGECDVTCGGGMQMRNVSCINLSNGTVVADSLCDDMRPEEFRPCGDEPCPTCSQYINVTGTFIDQRNYEPNQDCLYTVDFEESDSCVAVTFISFSIQEEEDGECNDYLELNDLGPFSDLTEQVFCGTGPDSFGYQWVSRSGKAQLRFVSDDEEEGDGFYLSINAVTCPEYGYAYGNFSECSLSCGEGVQTRDVGCYQLDNGDPIVVVDERECDDPRPVSFMECDLGECPSCDFNFTLTSPTNSLVVGSANPYSPLSSCVNTVTTDEGMCIRVAFATIDIEQSEDCVNDSVVVADPNNEEINFALCMRGGIVLPIYSTGNELTLTFTSNEEVEGMGYSAIASRIDCPDVAWATQDIGSCSVTCGTGMQRRDIYCMNQLNGRRFLQEESCTEEKPDEFVPCVLDDCPEACDNVFMMTSQMELKSPGFPDMNYENDLTCPNTYIPGDGSCLAIVVVEIDLGPVENCDNDYLEIFDLTTVNDRLRLCGNELPDNNLWVGRNEPFFTNFVTNGNDTYTGYNISLSFVPCPTQEFTVGAFGECSAVCGSGVMTRSVTCENGTGSILPDVQCFGQRPLSEEPCGLNCTYNYDVSAWSMCSATCGGGNLTRNVTCVTSDLVVVDNALCEQANLTLPETTSVCNTGSCPLYSYVASSYSSCSMSCGDGVQIRTVSCEDDLGNTVDNMFCSMLPMFNTTMSCNLGDCPTYQYVATNYSECSATCGNGVQTRNVSCEDDLGNTVDSLYCSMLPMLNTTMSCNLGDCPTYQYVATNYSECSATCGDGIQTRNVSCEDNLGNTVDDMFCSMLPLLNTTMSCNLGDCPTYQYVTSNYSECSVTCGDGVQTRTVLCEDNNGNNVSSSLCGNQTVPDSTQMCSEASCPLGGCNYNISGTDALTGNLSSPNYPNASPASLSCPITFYVANGYILNIRFTEFNLDNSCSENITLTGDIAGETFFCSGSITLPASATYSSDSTVSLLYLTDSDESNTPYYFAEWQLINLTG